MDYLVQLLSGLLHNQNESGLSVVVMIAGAVFILSLALMILFKDFFDPVRSRFKREINAGAISIINSKSLSKRLRAHNNVFVPSDKPLLQRTTLRLNYAGYHSKNSLLYYYALRMLLMIVLPSLTLVITGFMQAIKGQALFQSVMVAFVFGYMGPSLCLDKLIKIRQKTIRRAFPDALDLLVVCSEAGLSLDSALQKVANELGISQPVLADELEIVIAETRAGIDRNKALKRLVERTGVEDIKGLVSAISQSMRFGTSIAETLRGYSEELRDKRTQAAEEMAAKIGIKLIFPLGVCLLPAFLLIVMSPAVITLQNLFK